MNRLRYKREIQQLLKAEKLEEILPSLARIPQHILINQLFSALCHPDAVVRWNGVKCLGHIVPQIAARNLEEARIIMRRCLWALNDESGGIGWGIPETMAEIMVHDVIMRDEYLHMLISYMREDGEELFADGNYLELPMLQRGLLWGVGRLCQQFPAVMREHAVFPDILAYLHSADVTVVGYALRALGFLGDLRAIPHVRKFVGSTTTTHLYDGTVEGALTIGAAAENALAVLAEKKTEK